MTGKKQIIQKIGITAVVLAVVLAGLVLLRGNPVPPKNTNSDGLRIISLAPSITEMLFALEAGDSIVGATEYCNYPLEAKDIERVGSFGPPNIEKLLSLSPDIVISTKIPDTDVCRLLSKNGIELLEVKIYDIETMLNGFRILGHVVSKSEQAEKLITEMQTELNVIRQQYSKEQLTKVFIEIWNDPVTTAGGTSYIDDVITQAGGINVAGDISQDYPCINPEEVIHWNPDVIITCYMGGDGHSPEQMAKRIGWSEISAVKSGRIINDFPSDLILRPGPRLIEGVKALAEILHKKTERH